MIISKLDAARIQLDAAIKLFFEGDQVCAVTLAGAAEDIFAGLLNATGEQSPFEFLHGWYQSTYDKKVSKNKFSREMLNLGRNWLKHSTEDANTEFDIAERDSIMVLMRAIPCYFKLTKSYTENMDDFRKYFRDNIAEIEKAFLIG